MTNKNDNISTQERRKKKLEKRLQYYTNVDLSDDKNYWKRRKENSSYVNLEVSQINENSNEVSQIEDKIKILKKEKQQHKELYSDKFVKNENADNYLYYFRFLFKNKKYYKVGIISRSLLERYGKEYGKIDKVLYCERIDGAIKIEKESKERFKDDIFPIAYLNGGGHTETFDRDILELDN